jgi:nucleoside-diphosphate-sugar epimerase
MLSKRLVIDSYRFYCIKKLPVMRIKFPFVHVEDVSRGHLQAIKVPEAAGHRFVLNEKCYWMRDVA